MHFSNYPERNENVGANKTTPVSTMFFCWLFHKVTEYEQIIMVIVARYCDAKPQTRV